MSTVGSRFAGRHKRASVTRAERQRARALATAPQTPQNPHPFMLAPPPAFPSDVAVPPHRGAVIGNEPADSLSDYTIAPAPKTKAGAKKPANGKAAPKKPAAAKPGAKRTSPKPAASRTKPVPITTIAPKPGSKARPVKATAAAPSGLRPPAPPPAAADLVGSGPETARPAATIVSALEVEPALAAPPATAELPGVSAATEPDPLATFEVPSAPPPPRESANAETAAAAPAIEPPPERPAQDSPAPSAQRALVTQDNGLIGRLVAWLGRLVPRKRRVALPKARTRLERPVPPVLQPPSQPPVQAAAPAPTAPPASGPEPGAPAVPLPPAAEPLALPTESILSGRMVLKLSEENSRLRRELEALRATVDKSEES